jgi:hypothetical protein
MSSFYPDTPFPLYTGRVAQVEVEQDHGTRDHSRRTGSRLVRERAVPKPASVSEFVSPCSRQDLSISKSTGFQDLWAWSREVARSYQCSGWCRMVVRVRMRTGPAKEDGLDLYRSRTAAIPTHCSPQPLAVSTYLVDSNPYCRLGAGSALWTWSGPGERTKFVTISLRLYSESDRLS